MKNWSDVIEKEKKQQYFQSILHFVKSEREAGKVIYPQQDNVFSAFESTAFEQVKIVILGQDPYHGAGQAHGLCFSVLPEIKVPPSLVNIYKELSTDIADFRIPESGYLQPWAEQGVLLLNTVLTVEEGKAHSHAKCGWERFTDAIIQALNDHQKGIIFLLWGAHAHKKGKIIDRERHHVLTSAHPSPLSAYRGFWGCKHFSKANELLEKMDKLAIDWQV